MSCPYVAINPAEMMFFCTVNSQQNKNIEERATTKTHHCHNRSWCAKEISEKCYFSPHDRDQHGFCWVRLMRIKEKDHRRESNRTHSLLATKYQAFETHTCEQCILSRSDLMQVFHLLQYQHHQCVKSNPFTMIMH